MPRKSHPGLRPGIASTNAQKRKLFGVSQTELEQILATVRRFMTEYLDIEHFTSNQEDQRTKVENAVKESYPEIFGDDEYAVKMRYVRYYINKKHGTRRAQYFVKLQKGGGRRTSEVVGPCVGGDGGAMAVGEGAGPSRIGKHLESHRDPPRGFKPEIRDSDSTNTKGPRSSLPSDSISEGSPTHPRAKPGRPPTKSERPLAGNAASTAFASASTARRNTCRVEVVIQPRQGTFRTAQPPPPHPKDRVEITPKRNSGTGISEVERFLRACKPSLIHLLDHLTYYGCINGDFLECLAERAKRLEEEEFHRYLRNHFSKGQLQGRRDLTEMEVLVLTEALLRYRDE